MNFGEIIFLTGGFFTMAKQKMSNKKFLSILIPILFVLLALIIALTAVANVFKGALDTYLGRGERKVTEIEGTDNWDKNYYDVKYSSSKGESGSQLGAAKTAKKVADEGIVLLKNTGSALPLEKNSKVAPFGYRYYNPFYGGSGSGSMVATDEYVVTPEKALQKNFSVLGTFDSITGSTKVKKYYYDISAGNDVLYFQDYTNSFNGSDQSIYEFDKSVYDTSSVGRSDTAIVFLGRSGGENNDVWSVPYNKKGDVNAADAGNSSGGIASVLNAEDTQELKYALELMPEEKETIELAKKTCGKVVVIINSSNAMELGALADDDGVDAILWIGGPGAKGFESMSDILCGAVNPSGRLVDTYVRDISKDPTYKNIGDVDGFAYTNTDGLAPMAAKQYSGVRKGTNPMEYIEYEEGIYLGYKYYETAFDTNLSGFTYGELNADGSTKTAGQVVYPFGYGLSYSAFEQKIVSFSGNEDKVTLSVEVTNTGNVAGKSVVEVYLTAPYTDVDKEYKIEKSSVVFAAYDKTEELKAGGKATIEISFDTDDLASYCYTRDNGDGTTGCYMLDAGEYTVSIRSSSHEVLDEKSFNISNTIWFNNSNPRSSEKDAQSQLDEDGNPTNVPAKAEQDKNAVFIAATNNFEDSNRYMTDSSVQRLTRSESNGLSVDNLVAGEKYKVAPDWVVEKLAAFDVNTDSQLGNISGSKVYKETAPTSKANNGKTVSDMRGVDYYSPEWDLLLDQIDYSSSQITELMFYDQYTVRALDSIGLGTSKSLDGPQGLTITTNFGANDLSTCAWPTEPVLAATYNPDLAYEYGVEIGQEALTIGCYGWYAPGLNIHRTAFSGRNFEYYSEDAVLSGKMAARVISGAANQGLSCYMKHFAMNDNDSNRANICVWANEQTMRENYLRSFEIAVKEARATIDYISDSDGTHSRKVIRGATALMTSYNYVGATFSSGNYGLITETLRGEWGFQGAIISDMTGGDAWRRDQMLRAGNDMCLWIMQINAQDTTSPSAQWAMREAVHHIAYMVANSSNMQGVAPGEVVSYGMSPWAIGLMIANIVVYAFIVAMVVYAVLRVRDSKKKPEKYKE